MKEWDKFFDYVLPDIPNVDQVVAKHSIKSAAIEFCEKTYIHNYETESVSVTAGDASYMLTAPIGHEIVHISAVYIDGKQISPASEDRLQRTGTMWTTDTGPIVAYMQREYKDIRLYPIPINDATLNAIVVVVPTRESEGIEDWIFSRYVEVIAAGAKAKLMGMQQKPYSNPTMAAQNMNEFRAGITRARISANKSLTKTDTAIIFRKIY